MMRCRSVRNYCYQNVIDYTQEQVTQNIMSLLNSHGTDYTVLELFSSNKKYNAITNLRVYRTIIITSLNAPHSS